MICNNNYLADILRVCEIKDLFLVMHFQSPYVPVLYLSFVRTHTKFGINIFEIDFVIEIKLYLTFWPLPRGPWGGPKKAKKKFEFARPIHVSNSHTKFG